MKKRRAFFVVAMVGVVVWILAACGVFPETPQPNPTPTLIVQHPTNLSATAQVAATPTITVTATIAPPTADHNVRVAQQDVAISSDEEIVTLLLNQWLESYKEDSGKDTIEEFNIVRVMVQNDPTNHDYVIIAKAIFGVKPVVEYSQLWVSLASFSSATDTPWEYCGATFGVYEEDGYLMLKILPGWGT